MFSCWLFLPPLLTSIADLYSPDAGAEGAIKTDRCLTSNHPATHPHTHTHMPVQSNVCLCCPPLRCCQSFSHLLPGNHTHFHNDILLMRLLRPAAGTRRSSKVQQRVLLFLQAVTAVIRRLMVARKAEEVKKPSRNPIITVLI